jgi:outer membrane protein TolC
LHEGDIDKPESSAQPVLNGLSLSQAGLKEKYALANYRQIKATMLPTISAFGSNTDQQFNSKFSLFDNNTRWINSNYIGIKALWQIPNASTISQAAKAKYDYKLAQQNTNHSRLQATLDFEQLQIEAAKTKASAANQQQIYTLRADTYRKNLESYKVGILSLDILLNSYTAMVNSRYNHVSAVVNHQLTNSKIRINNNIR